ncbi:MULTISPECIES: hypothetical protein [unclassified Cryobacterium]|nr:MULTISPECIES: hypothetical protein [unclassified Cryobacterium]MDY7527238.1 hypothetical protein [Cryobacterium sp. 10C2]MEB0285893.1 hypothetical protein [Cryobacterium sp. 10S3]MEB0290975.1 hypothetical protein [Cryobacterium sp. 10C2]
MTDTSSNTGTAKEVTDVLPLSRMERLKTLDPRRKVEGRSAGR